MQVLQRVKVVGEDPWLATGAHNGTAYESASSTPAVFETPEAAMLSCPALLSAAWPLTPRLSDDFISSEAAAVLFPPGRTDEHGEQMDLRRSTSWTATLLGGVDTR